MNLQLTTVRSKKIVDFLIIYFHVGDTDKVFSVHPLKHRATGNAVGDRANTRGIMVRYMKYCGALSKMRFSASASHLLNVAEDFTHG